MKKIWIVGSMGHIGRALSNLLDITEYELFETDKIDVDITDEVEVSRFAMCNRPDVIVNCAGYNVYAKKEPLDVDEAYRVNTVGARNLAQAADAIEAKLIYLSTDDVFSEKNDHPYNEFDAVSPVGVFAKSKYAGEKLVTQLMTRHVIVRSSWIYGIGKDFLDFVIAAAEDEEQHTLTLDNNAIAVPTSAEELAKVIVQLIDGEHYGIYHAVCAGTPCTRQEYAKEILRLIGKEDQLEVVVRDQAPQPYSVLDNMMLRITGLEVPADWRETLADYLARTGGQE